MGQIARDCDGFVRRSVLKALSSDETAAVFNGKREVLEQYMLRLLFRVPVKNRPARDTQPEPGSDGTVQGGGT